MANIRTKKDFRRLRQAVLSQQADRNIAGFTGNPDLNAPPVTPAQLTTLKKAYDDALAAATKGGVVATANKNTAKVALIAALLKLASYTDMASSGDIDILLSSGFDAVSTNRTQVALNPPQIIEVRNGQSGQLKPRVRADRTTKSIMGRSRSMAASSDRISRSKTRDRFCSAGSRPALATSSSSVPSVAAPGKATGPRAARPWQPKRSCSLQPSRQETGAPLETTVRLCFVTVIAQRVGREV